MLPKLYKAIIKAEEFCSRLLLIAIVLITFGAAVTRFMNISFMWSLDLVLLLFAWFAFFASSQAIRRKSTVNVTLLTSRLPVKVRQCIEIFNDLLMIAFMVLIIYYSINLCIINWRQSIITLKISYSWIVIALITGGFLMLVGLCVQLYEHIMVMIGKKTSADFEVYATPGGDGK